MKKLGVLFIAVVGALVLVAASAFAVGPVDNDDFADRVVVDDDGYAGDNLLATAETNEPGHEGSSAQRSVWLQYTAAVTGGVGLFTCTQNAAELTLDTRMDVYTGTASPSVDGLTRVTPTSRGRCGPASSPEQQNFLVFQATAGTEYFIAIDGVGFDQGTYELETAAGIPVTVIDSGPEGNTTDSTPTFTYHGEPATADFRCGLALDTPGPTQVEVDQCPNGSFTSPALAPGDYLFAVQGGRDGFYDETPAFRQFTVVEPPVPPDTTDPNTTITKAPKAKVKKKGATFEFKSNEAGSTFECSLNGSPFATCASPRAVKARKGRNTFTVLAIDAAGNVDSSPATHKWKFKKKKKKKGGKKKRVAPAAPLTTVVGP